MTEVTGLGPYTGEIVNNEPAFREAAKLLTPAFLGVAKVPAELDLRSPRFAEKGVAHLEYVYRNKHRTLLEDLIRRNPGLARTLQPDFAYPEENLLLGLNLWKTILIPHEELLAAMLATPNVSLPPREMGQHFQTTYNPDDIMMRPLTAEQIAFLDMNGFNGGNNAKRKVPKNVALAALALALDTSPGPLIFAETLNATTTNYTPLAGGKSSVRATHHAISFGEGPPTVFDISTSAIAVRRLQK